MRENDLLWSHILQTMALGFGCKPDVPKAVLNHSTSWPFGNTLRPLGHRIFAKDLQVSALGTFQAALPDQQTCAVVRPPGLFLKQ